jgi:hypothetical protein
MAFLLTALVLLTLIAVSVTVVDAVRASHWRGVAVERRQCWRERAGDDEEDPDPDDGSGLGTEPFSYARG